MSCFQFNFYIKLCLLCVQLMGNIQTLTYNGSIHFRFYSETKFKNSDTGEPRITILLWLWSEFDSDRYDSELASRNTFFTLKIQYDIMVYVVLKYLCQTFFFITGVVFLENSHFFQRKPFFMKIIKTNYITFLKPKSLLLQFSR